MSIVSDNGLSPIRRQAITSTNVELLTIGSLGTNFSKIRTKIRSFSFMKMHLIRSSAKWRPFCPGGDELTFSLKDVTYQCLSWLLLELDAHIASVIFIV